MQSLESDTKTKGWVSLKEYSLSKSVILASLSMCIALSFGILFLVIGAYFLFSLVIAALAIPIIFVAYIACRRRNEIARIDTVAILLAFLFSIFNAQYHHVTLWGGYDSGVYSFSAISIAKTGSLFIPFQGYPFYAGFDQVQGHGYTTMFLPGYSTVLSLFHKVSGLGGMFWLNAFIIFFTLIILYLVAKLIAGSKAALIFMLLFSLHYTTIWFSRQTLSENLMVPLLWLSFCLYIYGVKERNGNLLLASFIPLTLGLMVRFEAILYLFIFVLCTLLLWIYNRYFIKKRIRLSKVSIITCAAIIFNCLVLFLYLYISRSAYFFLYLKELWNKATIPFSQLSLIGTSGINNITQDNYVLRYVFDCFNAYMLVPLLLFVFIGIKNRKYNYKFAVLLFLSLPAFVLIRYPTISWVHPWFMRHFWVNLIPLIILAAAVGLEGINNRYYMAICLLVVVLLFIMAWMPMLTFAEERGLPSLLEKIDKSINDRDAVLIIPLNDHTLSEPLFFIFGYRTVSSNMNDLDIDRVMEEIGDKKEVFVVTSNSDESREDAYEIFPVFHIYSDQELEMIGSVSERRDVLERDLSVDRYVRPENIPMKVLHLGYQPIKKSLDNLPPVNIIHSDNTFYIYKLRTNDE